MERAKKMKRMTWEDACKKYPNHWILMADPKYSKNGDDKVLIDGIFEGAARSIAKLMTNLENFNNGIGHVMLHSVRDK